SRRRDAVLRVLGAVGLVTGLAWVASAASASGPTGMPRSFESGLRYLAPALVLGLALLPVVARASRGPRRAGLLGVLLVSLGFADASAGPWYSGYLAAAVALGAAAVATAALLGSARLRMLPRAALAALAAGVLVLAVGAGWIEQRRYLDHRYANPAFSTPGLDAAFAW